ncbi:glucokinase [Thermoproteus sp. CP80]|jgi:glucokinase (EC 2.7.1.2)|uniref:ATP-dependent glucokinase n=1 Tax=Thermoproteus sp. CP80 TaxID=1650659 RepID=UPI000747575E|nr:ATP-dependent glucokinase [Thermoproteus sp. CP80]KUO85497.1 MAG: glucokinase [Thermoproteus sp. CIS_19]PLC67092.1 glucokinase [Thermoproteus sp. CP80]
MILAIDVGATWTRVLLVERDGSVRRREKLRTGSDPVGDAARLAESWDFEAVGVGSIGPLDLRTGWVTAAPNSPSNRFPLVEPLLRFRKPIYAANDCVAAAWGEYVLGGWGVENLAYLTVSTGLGVGAVVNGHLLLGKEGNAHELGHAVLDLTSGVKCGCGGLGHWEAMASGANIPRYFRAYAERLGRRPPEVRTSEDVFRLYREGDPLAQAFIDHWLDVNAAGIAVVTAAYDPEVLLVGGSIALNHWDVFKAVEDRLRKYTPLTPPALEKAKFGDDEVAIGAAALAIKPPDTLKKFGYPKGV